MSDQYHTQNIPHDITMGVHDFAALPPPSTTSLSGHQAHIEYKNGFAGGHAYTHHNSCPGNTINTIAYNNYIHNYGYEQNSIYGLDPFTYANSIAQTNPASQSSVNAGQSYKQRTAMVMSSVPGSDSGYGYGHGYGKGAGAGTCFGLGPGIGMGMIFAPQSREQSQVYTHPYERQVGSAASCPSRGHPPYQHVYTIDSYGSYPSYATQIPSIPAAHHRYTAAPTSSARPSTHPRHYQSPSSPFIYSSSTPMEQSQRALGSMSGPTGTVQPEGQVQRDGSDRGGGRSDSQSESRGQGHGPSRTEVLQVTTSSTSSPPQSVLEQARSAVTPNHITGSAEANSGVIAASNLYTYSHSKIIAPSIGIAGKVALAPAMDADPSLSSATSQVVMEIQLNDNGENITYLEEMPVAGTGKRLLTTSPLGMGTPEQMEMEDAPAHSAHDGGPPLRKVSVGYEVYSLRDSMPVAEAGTFTSTTSGTSSIVANGISHDLLRPPIVASMDIPTRSASTPIPLLTYMSSDSLWFPSPGVRPTTLDGSKSQARYRYRGSLPDLTLHSLFTTAPIRVRDEPPVRSVSTPIPSTLIPTATRDVMINPGLKAKKNGPYHLPRSAPLGSARVAASDLAKSKRLKANKAKALAKATKTISTLSERTYQEPPSRPLIPRPWPSTSQPMMDIDDLISIPGSDADEVNESGSVIAAGTTGEDIERSTVDAIEYPAFTTDLSNTTAAAAAHVMPTHLYNNTAAQVLPQIQTTGYTGSVSASDALLKYPLAFDQPTGTMPSVSSLTRSQFLNLTLQREQDTMAPIERSLAKAISGTPHRERQTLPGLKAVMDEASATIESATAKSGKPSKPKDSASNDQHSQRRAGGQRLPAKPYARPKNDSNPGSTFPRLGAPVVRPNVLRKLVPATAQPTRKEYKSATVPSYVYDTVMPSHLAADHAAYQAALQRRQVPGHDPLGKTFAKPDLGYAGMIGQAIKRSFPYYVVSAEAIFRKILELHPHYFTNKIGLYHGLRHTMSRTMAFEKTSESTYEHGGKARLWRIKEGYEHWFGSDGEYYHGGRDGLAQLQPVQDAAHTVKGQPKRSLAEYNRRASGASTGSASITDGGSALAETQRLDKLSGGDGQNEVTVEIA